jgi:hypothetical protein
MVAKFCTQCGLELPEDATCSCTNTPDELIEEAEKAIITETEITSKPAESEDSEVIDTVVEVVAPPEDIPESSKSSEITPPPPSSAPPAPTAMDKAKVIAKEQAHKAKEKAKQQLNATLKQTSDVVGTSCSFLKRFVKEPVTALHSAEIKISEAIFFILIGFLGLFAFVAVAYRHAYNFVMDLFHEPIYMSTMYYESSMYYEGTILGIAFGEWVALFFHMLLFYVSWILIIVILGYLYGKLICKAKKTLTLKGLFTRVVAAKVPMAFMFLLAAIFMLFLTPVAIALAVFGFVIPILLFPFILQPTPNVSINRAVYGTIIIHGLINSLILLYIWNYAYTLLPF